MNKVILVGRLSRDPSIRYTQSGKVVTSFSLAVNRRFSRNTDQEQKTDFIPIVARERLAEIYGNNLFKGSQILVIGRVHIRTDDAHDGSKRYLREVVAQDIECC